MANILVAGGAGYIGGALTDRLMETSHNVRVYDSLLYEESYRKPVSFVLGDIGDEKCLQPHLQWADVVVWLAAIVGDEACALNPELAMEINQASVQALVRRFHGRIIFASTCSVYGASEGLLDEDSPVNPLSVYAEGKLEAERHLSGQNAISFRLGTLFGVGDIFSRIRMDLVVNILTARAFKRGQIKVFGGGQYRPLLHVKDVAEAIAQNIGTPHTGVFNLHAVNMRIADLAELLGTHFPDLEIERTPEKFQDNRNYRVSSEKAVTTFKFKPQYTVDDGIEELKTLLLEGRVKKIGINRHSNYHFLKESFEHSASRSETQSWI